MAESVELVTIWLVDLVGSTRLATSVGPLRADELRDEYFALLREAIAASGGTEFKNTGDGLFVAFRLVARGDTQRAREHAARALELARRHGYGAFEPRAAAILASDATIRT